jgi:hypothetical protein
LGYRVNFPFHTKMQTYLTQLFARQPLGFMGTLLLSARYLSSPLRKPLALLEGEPGIPVLYLNPRECRARRSKVVGMGPNSEKDEKVALLLPKYGPN